MNNATKRNSDPPQSPQESKLVIPGQDNHDKLIQPKKEAKRRRKRMKRQLNTIRQQMEFYFCDANVHKDKFLMNEVKSSTDGYVDLDIFLNFNRIRSCTADVDVIRKALESSEFLQLNCDKTKVRRIQPIAEEPPDVDDRTIYVENLPPTADHEWVKKVFSSCGRIVYVSLPKFKHNQRPKGFAFVEFDSTESAQKSLGMRGHVHGEGKDERKSKPDHTPSGPKNVPSERSSLKRSGELDTETGSSSPTGASVPKRVRFSSPADSTEDKDTSTSATNAEQTENRAMSTEGDNSVPERANGVDNSSSTAGDLQKGHEIQPGDKTSNGEAVSSTLTEAPDVSADNSETETTVAKKKKIRKRKLKRCKKEKNMDATADSKLRIMSKKEWLELRKEYLKLQRKSMSQLKKNILSVENTIQPNPHSQISGNSNKLPSELLERSTETPLDENKEKVKLPCELLERSTETPLDENKEKVKVVPGTILKIENDTPLNDDDTAKSMKNSIREFSDGVEYVEAEVGHSCAYVRFSSPAHANNFLDDWPKNSGWGNKHMKILDGVEEAEYRARILEHRRRRSRNKKKWKKIRGKTKLVKKAEMASAKQASHIRFDEDSNDGL